MVYKLIRSVMLFMILLSNSYATADELIMCSGGRVKVGDAFEKVKKRCGSGNGYSGKHVEINGKRVAFKTVKIIFPDGTKAAFIYKDLVLFDVIVF
ncbi:hypothetical protein HWV00_01815 [Moritella sp. 24]|uniref:hypothetical protein n=1 Tax=Moritella sp. 24 TaxID=2746230 RepID=UPI001BAD9823|nr:hypothetical protein [Moritella sp. 24]QUM75077.1 hypothetical protein HWV00_01815 [Moritella sp. 24]